MTDFTEIENKTDRIQVTLLKTTCHDYKQVQKEKSYQLIQ